MKANYERKTHYMGVEDVAAIAAIRARYGLSTDSDAIRLAVRLVAASPVAVVGKKKTAGK